jgi:D-xylose transport system permease protein
MNISKPADDQNESFKIKFLRGVGRNIQSFILIFAVVIIWAIFYFLTKGSYLGPQNISNLFRQMSVTSLMSLGMLLVILTGGIDLSVGKLAGFVSVVVAYLQFNVWYTLLPGQVVLPAILSVICGLLVGLLFGALQGSIIAFGKLPSFIVTLGGQWLFNGLLLLVTQGKTIAANQPVFSTIGQGYIPPVFGWGIFVIIVAALLWNMFNGRRNKLKYGFQVRPLYLDLLTVGVIVLFILAYVFSVNSYKGIPVPVMILAVAAVIMAFVVNNTRFGRYTYAYGGNNEAARLSGIDTKKLLFMIFTLMGGFAGLAGIVLASYVGYGTIAAGTGYELDVIAACILGGTSPLGGVGTIPGVLIGALIIASLTTGLQMLNVAPAWQYVVKAIILVAAVYLDVYFKTHRK